jgi:hypothetical protein
MQVALVSTADVLPLVNSIFSWRIVCTLSGACPLIRRIDVARLAGFLLSLVIFVTPIIADAQGRGRGRGVGRLPSPSLTGRGYEEPAFARGYADGFTHAQEDRRERRRYDPVAHREYRDADQGFSRSYGALEAYRNNYRAGFRAGYDTGYRDDSGRRR